MSTQLEAYERMLLLRIAEEEIAKLYLEEKIMSFVHFYVGQEAVAVGVSDCLGSGDRALGNHRSHGHYLAKGGDLRRMLCELLGKAEGSSKGKGGSMHMIDDSAGFSGSTPILGSIAPIAAGSAFEQQYAASAGITVAYFGDGASEEGGVYETMNLATLLKLPLLIVIENNLYSVNSKLLDRRSEAYSLEGIVTGLGLAYGKADGNDYEDVREKAETLIKGVRAGKPAVLECIVYRHMAHSAPIFDDAQGHREQDPLEVRTERDSLKRLKTSLIDGGVQESALVEAEERIRAYVRSEIAYAKAAPYPSPETLFTDLYA